MMHKIKNSVNTELNGATHLKTTRVLVEVVCIMESELKSCYINVVLLINVSEAFIAFTSCTVTQIEDLLRL